MTTADILHADHIDAPDMALRRALQDEAPLHRGPFPFRLLALGYGFGLLLAVAMVGIGFGPLAAAAIGWVGGVAAMTGAPLAGAALGAFLDRVQRRARDDARRRATLEAWRPETAAAGMDSFAAEMRALR